MWFLNQTPSRACGHFRFRSCIRSFTYWLSDYSYRHGTCFRHYLLSNKIYFPIYDFTYAVEWISEYNRVLLKRG